MVTPRLWFFEGLDKTGKTSLYRACRYSSGHAVPFYDRGPVSRHLFIQYHGEPVEKSELWYEVETKLLSSELYGIVYVKASLEVIRRRMEQAGEIPQPLDALEKQRDILELLIRRRKECKIPVVTVDTTFTTVEQSTRQILTKMGLPFVGFATEDTRWVKEKHNG